MAKESSTSPAIQGTGNEDPRSESEQQIVPTSASPAAQKSGRGRGRPPKSKDGVSAKPAAKKSIGRPKRIQGVSTTSVAAAVKRRGPRVKSESLPVTTTAPVTVSRKRGRPTKEAAIAAALPKKRGRKPKSEVVVAAKSVGRPKKDSSVASVAAATGGDFKKKAVLLQKKVKEAAAKLEKAVAAIEEVQVIVDEF